MKNLVNKFKLILVILFYPAVLPLSILAAAETPTPDKGKDLIFFINQDRLHGNLITINNKNEILWKYNNVKEFIKFPLKKVDYIQLSPPPLGNQVQNNSTISLTNGDLISGNIISMKKEKLFFETECAGKLTIPIFAVKEITHSPANKLIYSGPKPEDNWQHKNHGSNDKWIEIKEGIMTIPPRYWATLDVKLPEKSRIDFTVIAPQSRTQLQFFFYTVKGDAGYFLNQQGSYFELERMTEEEGSDSIDNIEMPEIIREESCKITILVNKVKKQILLLFNGKLQGHYKDEFGNFAGKGQAIALFNTGRIPVQVKQIKVSEWDGNIPNENIAVNFKDNDIVYFINKDKSSGKLEEIKNKTMIFSSDFGKFKIPMARIDKLLTATQNHHLARRNKNDIQIFLPNQERLTVDLKGLKKNILTGSSENFRQANFNLKYCTKIRFNIYQERTRHDNPIKPVWDKWTDRPTNLIHAPRPQEKLEFLDEVEEEIE